MVEHTINRMILFLPPKARNTQSYNIQRINKFKSLFYNVLRFFSEVKKFQCNRKGDDKTFL